VNKEIAEIKLHANLWRSVQLEITSIYGINKVLCIKLIDFLMEKHKVLVDRKNEKIVEIKAFFPPSRFKNPLTNQIQSTRIATYIYIHIIDR
jgi:hypothetical protein